MAKIQFLQTENPDEIVIKVTDLGDKGKPSSTGKSEVRGFGMHKVLASDGAPVILGLNVYTKA